MVAMVDMPETWPPLTTLRRKSIGDSLVYPDIGLIGGGQSGLPFSHSPRNHFEFGQVTATLRYEYIET